MIRAEVESLADAAEPIKVERPVPPVEPFTPFPTDVFPAPLRRLVEVGSKVIGCDPSFLALPALAVLASCIGNTTRVLLKRGWIEACVIWCAVIAKSGELKSPPMRLVMHPIYEAQRRAMARHAQVEAEYDIEKARFDSDMQAWKRKKVKDCDPPMPPERPVLKRNVTADVTPEALAPMLEGNPRGVLVARPELSAMIGGFGRYSGARMADAAVWLQLWDADTLIVDRKTGDKRTIFVRSAAVSVFGTIQPGTLERAFDSELREAGTLARFLFASPPSKPALWSNAELPEDVEREYADVVNALLSIPLTLDDNGDPAPRFIPLSDEAKSAFVAWHDEHACDTADAGGDLAASYSKIKGYCARFALILHLVAIAAGDDEADRTRITLPSLRAAIRLAEWFKAQARRVCDRFAENEEDRERRELAEWIERRGGSVTVRELTHGLRQYRNATDAARAALDDLAGAGFGRWEHPAPGPTGGRPSSRFHLVASVTVTETPKDDPTSDGIGAGDDGDAEKWGEL